MPTAVERGCDLRSEESLYDAEPTFRGLKELVTISGTLQELPIQLAGRPVSSDELAKSDDGQQIAHVADLVAQQTSWTNIDIRGHGPAFVALVSSRQIDDTLTEPSLIAGGDAVRVMISPNDGHPAHEGFLEQFKDRARSIMIGSHSGTVSISDVDAAGQNPHYVAWSVGGTDFQLSANMSTVEILALARSFYCG